MSHQDEDDFNFVGQGKGKQITHKSPSMTVQDHYKKSSYNQNYPLENPESNYMNKGQFNTHGSIELMPRHVQDKYSLQNNSRIRYLKRGDRVNAMAVTLLKNQQKMRAYEE